MYIILVQDSYHVEDDERSGCPAYDVKFTRAITFESKEELIAWIKKENGKTYSKPFQVFTAKELNVQVDSVATLVQNNP